MKKLIEEICDSERAKNERPHSKGSPKPAATNPKRGEAFSTQFTARQLDGVEANPHPGPYTSITVDASLTGVVIGK
jgi:hypothetical protein